MLTARQLIALLDGIDSVLDTFVPSGLPGPDTVVTLRIIDGEGTAPPTCSGVSVHAADGITKLDPLGGLDMKGDCNGI